MGYILPITNHTYVNYHARMIESKKSPHYIGEPYKISFAMVHEDEHNPYNQTSEQVETKKQAMNEAKVDHHASDSIGSRYHIHQQTKAVLTGKGRFLNEQA